MKDTGQTFRSGGRKLAPDERADLAHAGTAGHARAALADSEAAAFAGPGPDDRSRTIVGIIAGVAGIGKTAVGRRAAERLGWDFQDGDRFHSPPNVEKMQHGVPLTDDDRAAWLDTIHDLIRRRLDEGPPTVIACSALKESYREKLLNGNEGAVLVFLSAPPEVVRERIRARRGHFFDPDLLDSQYAALEEPRVGHLVDATRPLEEVVDDVVQVLRRAASG